jgi:TM2 domain-containing membrane protein YozV
MYCTNCGKEINDKAVVCVGCGVPVVSQKQTTDKKSKIVAGLLALFLGRFGAHKFYHGSWGWGIFYLVTTIVSVILIVSGQYAVEYPKEVSGWLMAACVVCGIGAVISYLNVPDVSDFQPYGTVVFITCLLCFIGLICFCTLNSNVGSSNVDVAENAKQSLATFIAVLFWVLNIGMNILVFVESLIYFCSGRNAYDARYNNTPPRPYKW